MTGSEEGKKEEGGGGKGFCLTKGGSQYLGKSFRGMKSPWDNSDREKKGEEKDGERESSTISGDETIKPANQTNVGKKK